MQQCELEESRWRVITEPKPYIFAILIFAGIILEIVIHNQMEISIVYTHFYYLIIIITGLWYGKRAIYVALFFGIMLLLDSYIINGIISPDCIMRALMFCIVGFVIGLIVEQMNCYRNFIHFYCKR